MSVAHKVPRQSVHGNRDRCGAILSRAVASTRTGRPWPRVGNRGPPWCRLSTTRHAKVSCSFCRKFEKNRHSGKRTADRTASKRNLRVATSVSRAGFLQIISSPELKSHRASATRFAIRKVWQVSSPLMPFRNTSSRIGYSSSTSVLRHNNWSTYL